MQFKLVESIGRLFPTSVIRREVPRVRIWVVGSLTKCLGAVAPIRVFHWRKHLRLGYKLVIDRTAASAPLFHRWTAAISPRAWLIDIIEDVRNGICWLFPRNVEAWHLALFSTGRDSRRIRAPCLKRRSTCLGGRVPCEFVVKRIGDEVIVEFFLLLRLQWGLSVLVIRAYLGSCLWLV